MIKISPPFSPNSVFDASTDRYDIYKVETIGDSYMVVSGLPTKNDEHAAEVAKMSLELLNVISGLHIPHIHGETFSLRIGIHSGKAMPHIPEQTCTPEIGIQSGKPIPHIPEQTCTPEIGIQSGKPIPHIPEQTCTPEIGIHSSKTMHVPHFLKETFNLRKCPSTDFTLDSFDYIVPSLTSLMIL